jgi:phage terminase small subunit
MAGTRASGGHARVGPTKKGAEATLQDLITDTTPPVAMTDDAALDHWRYYAPLLVRRGIFTESGRDVLVNLCTALAMRDRLERDVASMPTAFMVPVVNSAGEESEAIKKNPLLAELRAVRLECRQHMNDLALSPAAAMRMPARPDGKGDDIDDWGGGRKPTLKAVK